MRKIISLYQNAYGGLSRASWLLSFIMFVNRSGSMVIMFLVPYLNKGLGYTLKDAGLLASIYGVGSMAGSFLGGYLADKIGHFRVQISSLIFGGILFFPIIFLSDFWSLAIGLFILSSVTEMLRPANISSISFYAKPENVTRAFSLNRMAINLGFSIGPVIGGFLLMVGYHWIFIVDGVTCIIAGCVFYFFFKDHSGNSFKPVKNATDKKTRSPYTDHYFILFVLLTCCFAIMFFQIFSTLSMYYLDIRSLSGSQVGGLLALNGFIVFGVEMILVYLVGNKIRLSRLIASGLLCTGLAYALLTVTAWNGILYISMFILSLAEILAMPFMATLSVKRSDAQNRGKYMGMYSFAYATAFVAAPLIGTFLAEQYSFEVLWWSIGILSILTSFAIYVVVSRMEKEIAEEKPAEEPQPVEA